MSKQRRYVVAKCSAEKLCSKCSSISDPIVVNRGVHYTLYCSSCGRYIKVASITDRRYMYATKQGVNDNTPNKVIKLYEESEKTMFH